jgi:2,4-dienoyl-CoA reductase-like NADH-dependent reductase (Old Yellow Enzyme family)
VFGAHSDWGGSPKNRSRFSREILSRIRTTCGDDFVAGPAISEEPDVKVAPRLAPYAIYKSREAASAI